MALRDKPAARVRPMLEPGEKNYIHKRFHGDVARADSVAVPAHAGTGAPLPPPPGA